MRRILDLARPGRRLALVLLVSLCVGLAWVGAIDERSTEYVDGSLLQAGLAFATARGLNALISVMQSTTLSFSLFAGVHVTLGEFKDESTKDGWYGESFRVLAQNVQYFIEGLFHFDGGGGRHDRRGTVTTIVVVVVVLFD